MKTEVSGGGHRKDEEAEEERMKPKDSGGGCRDGRSRKRTKKSGKIIIQKHFAIFFLQISVSG